MEVLDKNGLDYFWEKVKEYINSNNNNPYEIVPIGGVIEWYSNTIPENYVELNGQAISRTEYSELFSLLGTSFGNGNGSTTFNVPTKDGRVGLAFSQNDVDFNTIGKTGGESFHTLTVEEMPSHTHSIPRTGSVGNAGYKSVYGSANTGDGISTRSSGSGVPHNNMQPYIVCKYIMRAK